MKTLTLSPEELESLLATVDVACADIGQEDDPPLFAVLDRLTAMVGEETAVVAGA